MEFNGKVIFFSKDTEKFKKLWDSQKGFLTKGERNFFNSRYCIYENHIVCEMTSRSNIPFISFIKESGMGCSSTSETYDDEGNVGYAYCYNDKYGLECKFSWDTFFSEESCVEKTISALMGLEFSEKIGIANNPSCPIEVCEDVGLMQLNSNEMKDYMNLVMSDGTF